MPQWQNDYMRGTGMEMYTEYLSSAFVGMTFPEAAEYVVTVYFYTLHCMVFAVQNVLHQVETAPHCDRSEE
jgi:potassium large conductance calcium-activated channel subfamily M alpha protein 1